LHVNFEGSHPRILGAKLKKRIWGGKEWLTSQVARKQKKSAHQWFFLLLLLLFLLEKERERERKESSI